MILPTINFTLQQASCLDVPQRRRIWVVEEEEGLALFISGVLEFERMAEVEAIAPRTAACLGRFPDLPDLMIFDLTTSSHDGGPLYSFLLERAPSLKEVPVIFISKDILPEDENIINTRWTYSRHLYISKPLTRAKLLNAITIVFEAFPAKK